MKPGDRVLLHKPFRECVEAYVLDCMCARSSWHPYRCFHITETRVDTHNLFNMHNVYTLAEHTALVLKNGNICIRARADV